MKVIKVICNKCGLITWNSQSDPALRVARDEHLEKKGPGHVVRIVKGKLS